MPWTERESSGGVGAGRHRWARAAPGGTDYTVVVKRGTTHVGVLYQHGSDDTLVTGNVDDFGGTGTDEYVSFQGYNTTDIMSGGIKESGAVNRRSASSTLSYTGGGWTQIDIDGTNAKGANLGYSHDVVTVSGVSRWFLVTTLTSASALEWKGSASYPGTGGVSQTSQAYASGTVYDEGCVADDGTDSAYGVALASGSGAIRLTRINTSGGEGNFEHTPTSWLSTDTREVGQCFTIGTKFVGLVYNSTRGETFVGITDDTTSWDNTQVLSGEFVGGVALSGTGYVMKTTGELYTSDGTTDFADVSDDVTGTAAILTPNPEGTAVQAWTTDGKLWTYSAPVAGSSKGPWNSWGGPWGNPWSAWGG